MLRLLPAPVIVALVVPVVETQSAAPPPRPGGLPGARASLGEVRLQHTGPPTALAFSPDGRRLASGGDGDVWLWDTATGRAIRHLDADSVRTMSFSPDGRTLVAAGVRSDFPPVITLWDTAAGRLTRRLGWRPPQRDLWHVFSAVFSPDGKRLAVSAAPEKETRTQVHVFDLSAEGWLPRYSWSVPADWQEIVRFTPDGKALVMGRLDEELRRHDAETGRQQNLVEGAPISVKGRGLLRIRKGNLLVVSTGAQSKGGTTTSTIEIMNGATGKTRAEIRVAADLVAPFALSADSRMLAATDASGRIWLCDVETGRLPQRPSRPERVILQVQFDAGGQPLAIGLEDGEVRFWNVRSGQIVRRLRPARGRIDSLDCLAISPDDTWLAVCIHGQQERDERLRWMTRRQTTHLWRLDRGRAPRTWTVRCREHHFHGPPAMHVVPAWSRYRLPWLAFSPDSRLLAEVDREGVLRVRETASGKEIARHPGPTVKSLSVLYSDPLWSPDSKQVAVTARFPTPVGLSGDMGDRRNGSRVLDVSAGTLKQANPSFRDPRWLSPDGSVLVHFSPYYITLTDARTGKPVSKLVTYPGDSLGPLLFSPNGRLLAVCNRPLGRIRLFEVASGAEVGFIAGHFAEIRSLAFSRDGKFLLSGSADGTAVLWDFAAATSRTPRKSAE
jgi:WD40 repeat protein